MKGKLKDGVFFKGNRQPFQNIVGGKLVEIINAENHPIYGKRYKIMGFDDWFEENCFEYIKKD